MLTFIAVLFTVGILVRATWETISGKSRPIRRKP